MNEYPVLNVRFKEALSGYWDGGRKYGGDFTPSPNDKFVSGSTIRWGCFALNFWFNAGAGKSWKEAASIAKRKLEHKLRIPAVITVNLAK